MRSNKKYYRRLAGFAALVAFPAVLVFAQEALRTNYIPSGDYSEGVVGDLWTFTCPSGGWVSVALDTRNDNGDGTSNLNPSFEIVDKKGNLIADSDDDMACTYDPACGYSCPQVVDVACGSGNPHTLAVYSVPSNPGNTANPPMLCVGGGGYDLMMSAIKRNGVPVKEKALKLGGSARRTVPKWAGGTGKQGPALDDEGVPSFYYPSAATFPPP